MADTSVEQVQKAETPDSGDQMDAALDAALAKAEQSDDAPPLKQRDEHGRFVSRDDTPAAEDEATYTADDIKRATAAALRVAGKDGVPKAISKAIDAGDEATIAYYLKLAKIQQDGDEFTKKYKSLQQELDAIKSAKEQGKGDAATATDQDADALADYLAEILGDDHAKEVVRKSLAGLTKSQSSALERANQQIAALQKRVEEQAIERARDALISDYPDLKDRELWGRVKKHLESLPESEDRPDLQTRLEHAARIELAPVLMQRAKAEQERRNRIRDNGTPTLPARSGESKQPTRDHTKLQEELLDALEKGDEVKAREIKAAINRKL